MDENESIFQWIITLHLRKCHCFHIFQETVMPDQHSIQYRHLTTAMSQNSHDRLTHKKQHVSPIGEVEKKTERRAIHVFCMQRISWKIVFNYGRIRIFNGSYSAWSNVDGLFAITMTTSSSPIYVNILTIWCRKISRHKDAKFRLKSSVKINAHRTPSN